MKNIKIFFSFLMLTLFSSSSVLFAQQKTADEIRKLVQSQNFVFKAEEANPARGGSKQLSAGYDLTITKNSIISYLPFFGRAQTATLDPADAGIKFTSFRFDYKTETGKKSWQIIIRPNDVSNVHEMYLNVYKNGTATLDVMNTSRDNISFSGYIQ